jgi:hypothetical protein
VDEAWVELLEDLYIAAKQRQRVFAAISSYTPKQMQEIQRAFRLAIERVEGFK